MVCGLPGTVEGHSVPNPKATPQLCHGQETEQQRVTWEGGAKLSGDVRHTCSGEEVPAWVWGQGPCKKLRAMGGDAREAGEGTGELRTGQPGGVAEEGASQGDPEDEAT